MAESTYTYLEARFTLAKVAPDARVFVFVTQPEASSNLEALDVLVCSSRPDAIRKIASARQDWEQNPDGINPEFKRIGVNELSLDECGFILERCFGYTRRLLRNDELLLRINALYEIQGVKHLLYDGIELDDEQNIHHAFYKGGRKKVYSHNEMLNFIHQEQVRPHTFDEVASKKDYVKGEVLIRPDEALTPSQKLSNLIQEDVPVTSAWF